MRGEPSENSWTAKPGWVKDGPRLPQNFNAWVRLRSQGINYIIVCELGRLCPSSASSFSRLELNKYFPTACRVWFREGPA